MKEFVECCLNTYLVLVLQIIFIFFGKSLKKLKTGFLTAISNWADAELFLNYFIG